MLMYDKYYILMILWGKCSSADSYVFPYYLVFAIVMKHFRLQNLYWLSAFMWQGILSLCGMHDAQAKPVLLCSCNDNCVRIYDLPS